MYLGFVSPLRHEQVFDRPPLSVTEVLMGVKRKWGSGAALTCHSWMVPIEWERREYRVASALRTAHYFAGSAWIWTVHRPRVIGL